MTGQAKAPSEEELGAFLADLHKMKSRDDQHVEEPNLVVSSSTAHWLTEEQTGNPSRIGLLLHMPTRATEFFLQQIPAGSATDLQRHVHESIHYVVDGSGWSEIGDQVVRWAKGDFVYTPPWIWHRHYAEKAATVDMIIIENSRLLSAVDATQRESLGNISFAEQFGAATTRKELS
ncbi:MULTISPECIES: cupin domain-containing protein [Micrococcaceae]|uniref:cupin domain-containing protein n=1 Tax=Micrococcaceae TaxID=1268 RepID=UPI0004AD51BA|nr:cupin domain-containing protein [Arthrobacter sp. MA-N2]